MKLKIKPLPEQPKLSVSLPMTETQKLKLIEQRHMKALLRKEKIT